MYKGIFIHTVQPEDVGSVTGGVAPRFSNSMNGIYKAHPKMFEPLGRVLEQDIGKQIWLHDGVYYVESAEQYAERLKKGVMI